MKALNAVVGYLPDAVAKAAGSKDKFTEPLEVKLERGSDDPVYVRISANDIAGVLLGASKSGETGVQVFLSDKATVETFSRTSAADFLKPIKDFSLGKIPRIPWNVIFVAPQFLDRLVEFNRQK